MINLANRRKKRKEFLVSFFDLADGEPYKQVDAWSVAKRLGLDYRKEATEIARYWVDQKVLDGGPFDGLFLTPEGVTEAEALLEEIEAQAAGRKCGRCSSNNRSSARFCDNCGFALLNIGAPTVVDHPSDIKSPVTRDSLVGRVLDSKYEIKNRLGEGGGGIVYRARHVKLKNEVAIKVLRSQHLSDPQIKARFVREAQAAANLSHPAIVVIHDFSPGESRQDSPAYIVMELVDGESLYDLIKREGQIEVGRAVRIITQVCDGVSVAHDAGIFHRDLKPGNIILLPSPTDGGGESVKIIDFGIAKFRETDSDSLTGVGTVIGTPRYMSPEQCRGERVNASSDVYALGIILYEMLAGTPPFVGTFDEIILKHQHESPPKLPFRPGLTESLEAVLTHALAKEPARRPSNAKVLSQELRSV